MPDSETGKQGIRIYRRLLGYTLPHWRPFVVAVFATGVIAVSQVAFAALMKPLLDASFVDRDPELISLMPLALVALFVVRGIASYTSVYWMGWVSRMVIKSLRRDMFNHMVRLPIRFFDHTPSGTLLSKLIYNVEQVASAATNAITVLVRDSLTVIGLLAWLFYLNWILASILLVGAPLVAQIISYVNRRFRRYSTRLQNSMGDVTHIAEESIEGQRVVKTFGGEGYERGRFEEANEQNRRFNMKLIATSAASVPVVQTIGASAAAGVIYVGTMESMLEALTVGTFVSFVTAMMMLQGPIKQLTEINAMIQRGIAAAESIFELLDTPAENDTGTLTLGRAEGRIAFRDVHFRYEAEKGMVLHGIDLTIEPGQSVALVGRSGSGKSTLANLLPRFYEPESGTILLDGNDIRDLRLFDLRRQIALVSQHVTLFNDTIAHNIGYGTLADASPEAIEAAAVAAHAMDFIRELPQGLDTVVGENGVLLSGGQRQRLAIARALLKDAPVLILDEATSALDTESERHIQAALEKLMENRTTLVIAHRLSTIEKADRIVVLDEGRIVESGRHHELLQKGGRYARLYELQFNDTPRPVPEEAQAQTA